MNITQETFKLTQEVSDIVVAFMKRDGWDAQIVMREGLEGMQEWEQLRATKDGRHFHMDTAILARVKGRASLYKMIRHHLAKVR